MGNDSSRPSSPAPPTEEPDGDPTQPASVRVDVDADLVGLVCKTSEFDSDTYLVTRRGVQISISLFSTVKLRVSSVVLSDYPSASKTVSLAHVEDSSRSSGSAVEVRIDIPVNCPVGEYELRVSGTTEHGQGFRKTLRRRVVVLFNAWSAQDAVFMESGEQRDEYVLNSKGRVYAGSLYGIPWRLALYSDSTLPAVLLLLQKSSLSFDQRRDPVLVAREMSAMVNVQDDRGVLVGNWSGEYSDGTSPSAWRGSGKILRQYYSSGGEPVRYGQCWVFSGVLLTVLRVLGIPSRSTTNFSSAHDTNRNRTIDEYYDEKGDKIRYLSSGSDSVW